MTDNQRGLYEKFHVVRTDGTDKPGGKHHNCDHFVLDATHDEHAAAALATYADSVEATHPQLAADMRARWNLASALPIDMVLHCPECHKQHIDAVESDAHDHGGNAWFNPPHKSHLCHGCGYIWRPADVPTNGVADTKTRGKDDSPKETPQ